MIVGPIYDWLFFLIPPMAALAVAMGMSETSFALRSFSLAGQSFTGASLMIGVLIHAHIILVAFRSHGNTDVFRRYPRRFILVPILLYLAMVSSSTVLVAVSVLAVFWDVYHSGAQTFGFGRIYDKLLGNDPAAGRRLDFWLNQLLYAGPIVAGACMLEHVESLDRLEDVGVALFSGVPDHMVARQPFYATILVGATAAFLVAYVFTQIRMRRAGHRISSHKMFLYLTTGMCSVYAWGWNAFGEAFFIMNLFHAIQYFGLVWASEKRTVIGRFGLSRVRGGKWIALAIFLLLPLAYGFFVECADLGIDAFLALTLVCSIMHFWYDGFIWSVRRDQVQVAG